MLAARAVGEVAGRCHREAWEDVWAMWQVLYLKYTGNNGNNT
jgi:hypothetical protein